MSEPTIEEAWAALEGACGQRMKLDKAAARALALASAMAGWEAAKKDLQWTRIKVPASAIIGLSAEIEALGR